ncbi:MAG TPA: TIGR03016 family PEP-CTERM system-associated outer membrane protein [Rhodanobacteraceae bacterium]
MARVRSLAAPMVLSSLALTGWLTSAAAQDTGTPPDNLNTVATTNPSVLNQTAGTPANLAAGEIGQPTPEAPGVIVGVTLGGMYTDNLRLSAQDQQSSWIAQVQPFVRAAWGGPRFSGIVDYALTGYAYTAGPTHHQLTQNLDANGSFAIVPQHFFIDGTATYQRATINNELPSNAGTYFLDNNRANVATASVSPWWTQQFGNVGTVTVRYTHGRVAYDVHGIPDQNSASLAGISDVTSDALQFNIVSPKDRRWGWNAGYTGQRLKPDHGTDLKFAVAKVGTWFQLNPSIRLLADAGKENKYLPDGTVKNLGATFWDVGFDWVSVRDHVKLLVGHRFYGHSADFSWTHTAALLTTNVSYIEQPTDLSQQLLGDNLFSSTMVPVSVRQIPSLQERQAYLMKRASASATYEMPRGKLTLELYDETRRYFTLDNGREKVANAALAWQIDLGALTTLTPSVGWQRYKFLTGQVEYTHFEQLALVHQFNTKNFGSVGLRNDDRNVYSAVPGSHDYRVNLVYLQWTHLL